MKEMKINSDLHFSCAPIPLSAAKDKCTEFYMDLFPSTFLFFITVFFLYHIHFQKKELHKSLHFKSLVKMHLFLNYFYIYTDGIL